ncbi:MAG: isoprenoid biosynthesis glyoxalase ElbB [Candidatus Cloacimonetes bacterium]|nr:isoprenoid biosynthesis glyoxalase ElbB [Candidatus Cloacimonadota bacterium]
MDEKINKTIGVILSGSGWQDGSEIHESVLTLYNLDKEGVKTKIFAPDENQTDVVHHISQEQDNSHNRNVMVESARIARGEISPLNDADANKLDGLVIPGGFGVAKNLCNYASKGSNMSVDNTISNLILDIHEQNKPLGFICISPVIAAKVLEKFKPKLTVGNDEKTINDVEKMGAQHIEASVDEIVFDETNNIVTTPAYMLGPSIAYVGKGISKLAKKVVELA